MSQYNTLLNTNYDQYRAYEESTQEWDISDIRDINISLSNYLAQKRAKYKNVIVYSINSHEHTTVTLQYYELQKETADLNARVRDLIENNLVAELDKYGISINVDVRHWESAFDSLVIKIVSIEKQIGSGDLLHKLDNTFKHILDAAPESNEEKEMLNNVMKDKTFIVQVRVESK